MDREEYYGNSDEDELNKMGLSIEPIVLYDEEEHFIASGLGAGN
jgi:hypothetical protein